MPDDVAMSTAAKELGLAPGAMELAAQLGEVRTVRAVRTNGADTAGSAGKAGGAPDAGREGSAAAAGGRPAGRVPRSEVARLRAAEDFPDGLRSRLHTVDSGGGALLLGITAARFARLARGGCFSPVAFYVNRYRTVVWLYLAAELRDFAGQRPELLSGPLPRGLRMLLAEGTDLRAGHWRGRRLRQLCRQGEDPWEAAAARAAVLSADVLEEAVPDDCERARLHALQPELTRLRGRSAAVRELTRELCTAVAEDEIFWQRLLLAAELETARAADRPAEVCGAARPSAPVDGRSGPGRVVLPERSRTDAEGKPDGCRAVKPREPRRRPRPVRPVEPVGEVRRAEHKGKAAPTGQGPTCLGKTEAAATAAAAERARVAEGRARVLHRLRAPRPRPAWWRRDTWREWAPGLSRPAF